LRATIQAARRAPGQAARFRDGAGNSWQFRTLSGNRRFACDGYCTNALTVIKQDGATSIEGVRLDGSFEEDYRAVFPVFDESRPFARIYFRFIDKTWQIITLQDQ
jgi:hypothetical protein